MKTPRSAAIEALRKAVIEQKTANMPSGGDTSIFHALHEAVQEYDQYVTQMVIGVLTEEALAEPFPRRTLVQTVLEEAETIAKDHQQRKVEQFRNYIQRLDHMHSLAIQVTVEDDR
jgi:Mg-chelatase subunit ChlD